MYKNDCKKQSCPAVQVICEWKPASMEARAYIEFWDLCTQLKVSSLLLCLNFCIWML